MFAINDEGKKLHADKPTANIFDGSASGRALTMRYSCDYPGSIVDQLRSSKIQKQRGIAQMKEGTVHNGVEVSSGTLAPSGDHSDSSSSSDSDDSSALPDVTFVSDAQNSARRCMAAVQNLNREVLGPKVNGSFAAQDEEKITRRQKITESLSCTDSDSDAEISASEYLSKNKLSHTKFRKRRKKLTANLAATRYDVGKE